MSLKDIVNAMSGEKIDSTLGWDVVVNYSAKEMNALLAAAHEKGGEGQLKDLAFVIQGYDKKGDPFDINYVFKLGAPSIQFTSKGIDPACSVTIPIIGGSVKTTEIDEPINSNVYSILVSEIPLATANGTVGASRNPQDSDKPFIFPSSNTTGVVTLNLGVADAPIVVDILIADVDKSKRIGWIDNQKDNLGGKIKTYLKDPHSGGSIRWDLAQANNNLPPRNETSLVPKLFRFAIQAATRSKEADTILSLFIQTDTTQRGQEKELQSHWSAKWSDYGVPPIPSSESYTASVIFNNEMILGLMGKSSKEFTIKKAPSQPTGGLKLTVLTHKSFHIKGENTIDTYYHATRSSVNESLDDESKALHITLGQHNNPDSRPSAQMDWNFDCSIKWTEWTPPNNNHWGEVTIKNKLKENTPPKVIDDSKLPDYVVHLNVSIAASDWEKPDISAADPSYWESVAGATNWKPDSVVDALPSLPTVNFELIDFNFFLTTNLLLPYRKVIRFDKDPGVRFPRDLYVVGHVLEK